jgi:surface antigen
MRKFIILFSLAFIIGSVYFIFFRPKHKFGEVVDRFHGVEVYYNGRIGNTDGRNVAKDGYNLGMKYQCVEFVKRFYYEYLKHKMPETYGNAKDFFDRNVSDGNINRSRDLLQFCNGSKEKPQENDLIIFDGHAGNEYGHVAIISKVNDTEIEIVQQNPGVNGNSRKNIGLTFTNGKWVLSETRILGWLRKK